MEDRAHGCFITPKARRLPTENSSQPPEAQAWPPTIGRKNLNGKNGMITVETCHNSQPWFVMNPTPKSGWADTCGLTDRVVPTGGHKAPRKARPWSNEPCWENKDMERP